jgi:hypothetical protein
MYDIHEETVCSVLTPELPPTQYVSARSSEPLPDTRYSLVDKWFDGTEISGITIPDDGNSPYYDISITTAEEISLLSYVQYNFLTAGVTLELLSTNMTLIATSSWDTVDDDDAFNLIASLDVNRLDPGEYWLRIVFDKAMIGAIFDFLNDIGRARCIEFKFNIETEVILQ